MTQHLRHDHAATAYRLRRSTIRAACALALAASCICTVGVQRAVAEPDSVLEQAVLSARGAAACGQLQPEPEVSHAAEIINQSTMDYLRHSAQNVPADNQHPTEILRDLGVPGTKSFALQGAAQTEGDAIKGLLVQGFSAIPDCGYTQFGTSRLYDPDTGYTLVVVVLVGP